MLAPQIPTNTLKIDHEQSYLIMILFKIVEGNFETNALTWKILSVVSFGSDNLKHFQENIRGFLKKIYNEHFEHHNPLFTFSFIFVFPQLTTKFTQIFWHSIFVYIVDTAKTYFSSFCMDVEWWQALLGCKFLPRISRGQQ